MQDAELKLAKGKRYGLVGRNGAGKSTLLRALHSRSLVLPEGVSLLHVEQVRDIQTIRTFHIPQMYRVYVSHAVLPPRVRDVPVKRTDPLYRKLLEMIHQHSNQFWMFWKIEKHFWPNFKI